VIGGTNAPDQRFGYAQITLQREQDQHQCGGVLIAPDIVLTAAHCAKWFTIVHIDRHDFGDSSDEFQIFDPVKTILHPWFELDTFRYDFAVVKLDRTVENIAPVRINSDSSLPEMSQDMTVIGWGAVDYSNRFNPVFPDILQRGMVRFVPNSVCEKTSIDGDMLYNNEIFPEMLCAINPGVDACIGDSGGPLVVLGGSPANDRLVGLVSWGRGCAVYPGVYSRVSSAFDWIRTKVCRQSIDPPSYLQCKAAERGAVVTSPSPTNSQHTVQDREGVSTNLNPALPLASKSDMVPLTVEIQLDSNSRDVGWFVATTGGVKIFDAPIGSYPYPNTYFKQDIMVESNMRYLFGIIDQSQDGICCGSGNGWYRLFLNSDEVVSGNGTFAELGMHFFYVPSAYSGGVDQKEPQSSSAKGRLSLVSIILLPSIVWFYRSISF